MRGWSSLGFAGGDSIGVRGGGFAASDLSWDVEALRREPELPRLSELRSHKLLVVFNTNRGPSVTKSTPDLARSVDGPASTRTLGGLRPHKD